ncbi:MMPL family transporter [Gordonia sp. X0973]|uniref:MMPL family transporter n=1 Tax=Gordonia sp. X0973 TaxID=2742602 RepID=UPI000F524E6F|nr:MMPL family transporter [Gordonia sp. X0973]QKT06602.1 MMPL family transporter [Gordonia sp. X0973]
MERLTRLVLAAPKSVLTGALALLVIFGVYGAGVAGHLLSGGFEDPHSESAQASKILENDFERGSIQVVFKIDAPGRDVTVDPLVAKIGKPLVAEIKGYDFVQDPVLSIWTDPAAAKNLISKDKSSTLIIVPLAGGENVAPGHAQELAERFAGERDGVTITATGQGKVFADTNKQVSKDLAIAEGIAIPISFIALIIIFGGVIAAALPLVVGIFAIVGTLALLRVFALFTDVSIFAMNLATAMGLALAIDYTLLIVTRYREEVAGGLDRPAAIRRAMSTAGRTVMFSAVTVGLSLSGLLLFHQYFLRSFAYAGLAVVVVALLGSLVITPALLAVLGDRIDGWDLRKPIRRLLGRPEHGFIPTEQTWWYRFVQWVLRRAAPVALIVTVLLLVLGAPFLSMKLGFPDDRILPTSQSSRVAMDEIRSDYAQKLGGEVTVVVTGSTDQAVDDYAAKLSAVKGADAVTTPDAVFAGGQPVGPRQSDDRRGDHRILTVANNINPLDDQGKQLLAELRAVPKPASADVKFAGIAASTEDTVASIYHQLPWVLLWIAVATFILLFLFTGSVVLPLKALVLNLLSLSVTFGAVVWIFQEGHFGALGTTATGFITATMPILMFCVAFGLSMDYEVFLLGRIREEWLKSDKTTADSDHAVAYGLASTGRVITAAALLMAIVFAAMIASQVSFMRMFGLGLTIAVLMDATLIRMLLVPAFMRLMGRANWWAPAPLRKLHDKIGLSES